jgi:hypothetical protein
MDRGIDGSPQSRRPQFLRPGSNPKREAEQARFADVAANAWELLGCTRYALEQLIKLGKELLVQPTLPLSVS